MFKFILGVAVGVFIGFWGGVDMSGYTCETRGSFTGTEDKAYTCARRP